MAVLENDKYNRGGSVGVPTLSLLATRHQNIRLAWPTIHAIVKKHSIFGRAYTS